MDTSNIIIETENLCLTGITLDYKDNIFSVLGVSLRSGRWGT